MQQLGIGSPYWLSVGLRRRIPNRLTGAQRVHFHLEGDLGVSVGGLQTDVSKPGADDVDLDTCFKQMHGRRVA